MIKDMVQVLTWIVAAVGGVIAAWRALVEMRRNREQRAEELRWRQAREAKEIIASLEEDRRARCAMTMLDWPGGRPFRVRDDAEERIAKDDWLPALRTENVTFTKTETFVRDCFDGFLDKLEHVNNYITIGLVNFSDVETPLGYYVKLMANDRQTIESFMKSYGYTGAIEFCKRFPCWAKSDSSTAGAINSPSP